MYLNALNPGNETKPHDHTTWAVVVAVEGQELNKVYRRTDDGAVDSAADIVVDHEIMVEPGTRHRADARGHPLDPHHRRGADAASAHVRPRHREVSTTARSRSRDRHGEVLYNTNFMAPERRFTRAESAAMKRIDAPTLRAWLHRRARTRAAGRARGRRVRHRPPVLGGAVPAVAREMRARALLPRLAVRIVCVDDGRGVAEQLAAWLEGDRLHRCRRARRRHQGVGGGRLRAVQRRQRAVARRSASGWSTITAPRASMPPDLKSWIDAGRDMVVLDSRTQEEFVRMSIPSGHQRAGRRTGLPHRRPRARSRHAGGGELRRPHPQHHGRRKPAPRRHPQPGGGAAQRHDGLGAGRACAASAGRTERVRAGHAAAPPRWRCSAPSRFAEQSRRRRDRRRSTSPASRRTRDRTLYVLDVRDPAEFRAGHRPGSRSAPGGQLVQATDQWIGVRNARIVLLDDDGVRARMAGAWLRQMGHRDVFVVEGGLEEARRLRPRAGADPGAGRRDEADRRRRRWPRCWTRATSAVVDLARSIDFRDGHIPGALWGVRTRLGALRDRLAGRARGRATSPDGRLARLAVAGGDRPRRDARCAALDGGTGAWRASGRPLVSGPHRPAGRGLRRLSISAPTTATAASRRRCSAYLAWEIDLVHEIARDGTVRFGVAELQRAAACRWLWLGGGRGALDLLLPPHCIACDRAGRRAGPALPRLLPRRPASSPSRCCVALRRAVRRRAAGGYRGAVPGLPDRAAGLRPRPRRAALRRAGAAADPAVQARRPDRSWPRRWRRIWRAPGRRCWREADLLVPVPLHRGRLFRRRYNQAALLAQRRRAAQPGARRFPTRWRGPARPASLGGKGGRRSTRGGGRRVRRPAAAPRAYRGQAHAAGR